MEGILPGIILGNKMRLIDLHAVYPVSPADVYAGLSCYYDFWKIIVLEAGVHK
jgi:hypothetical protein